MHYTLKNNSNALLCQWTINPWLSHLLTVWQLHEYQATWLQRTCNFKMFCSSRILWSWECWWGGSRACFHLAINKLISLSLAVERKNLKIVLKSRMFFFSCWYVGEERTIRILQNISKEFMQCSHTVPKKRNCTMSLYWDSYSVDTTDLTMSRFPDLV